jgi:rod shape-determining protein MreD
VSALRALFVLAAALVLQAGLGRLFPGIHRYVDVLLVPVVIYGVGSSQRAAMGMGCVAGLLSDTWFHGGPFGLNGFKRTLLGWAVGAFATRLDLNQPAGRLVCGALVSLADDVMDFALRGLLDAHPHFPSLIELVVRAVVTGLLVAIAGGMLDMGRRRRDGRARRVV